MVLDRGRSIFQPPGRCKGGAVLTPETMIEKHGTWDIGTDKTDSLSVSMYLSSRDTFNNTSSFSAHFPFSACAAVSGRFSLFSTAISGRLSHFSAAVSGRPLSFSFFSPCVQTSQDAYPFLSLHCYSPSPNSPTQASQLCFSG